LKESRISGLHRLSVAERIAELERTGWLSKADADMLARGGHVLIPANADRMIENVIGVFGLPFAIAPNFTVNGRDYIVPMVVEEPSIVAGVSFAATLARKTGGITAECHESLLAGQVHVTNLDDIEAALAALGRAKDELCATANAVHPRLIERGGGVRDIETHLLELPGERAAVGVHLLVDTCDAMGANLVNTMCEAVAPRLAELCKGEVALRILSNLADRSLVTARVRFEIEEAVCDGIALASDIARADPYRAATHNKGVMNGIDAVALATGNDWRAIEAGAHAYAASTGRYQPLAAWSVDNEGMLLGEITVPLKVGIVGGTKDVNSAADLGLRITGVESARELSELMAAVGLLQNFAALRALVTSGIQAGHMKLHARSVVAAAGAPDDIFEEVVAELVAGGDIKLGRAKQILAARQAWAGESEGTSGSAAGKVILFGEHAAVYGRYALALPIPGAVTATVSSGGTTLVPPEIKGMVDLIKRELGVEGEYTVRVNSDLPIAMGLGASAAFAVAITRALSNELNLDLDDDTVNDVAYKCEKLAHGTPSGIDNTIATYSRTILFRRGDSLETEAVELEKAPPIVIACSHTPGLTREQVQGVSDRRERNVEHYDWVFDQIDALSREGARALREGDFEALGDRMNVCHGLLNAIQVSTPELENMVALARSAGAIGAKLTGAGGGGSIVALCPGKVAEVREAFAAAGYRTIALD
jgi:hydroxymethylglutaryl-CoA reductase